MNIKETRKAESRVDTRYISSLNVKGFGERNLYPQELRAIVFASPNARGCYERRANYIEGDGLMSQALSDAICNRRGEKFDDIHALCSADLALYEGVALHFNYTIEGKISSVSHIPFENCRLEESDEAGVVRHIVVHPDWTGRLTRNGNTIKVNEDNIVRYNVFNPDPVVVQREIEAVGGIANYRGQVLYKTTEGVNTYCTPRIDASLTDISTDEGISNVNYRNVRYNFLTGGLLWVKRSAGNEATEDALIAAIENLQGDTHACKIGVCFGETDEDKPELIPFAGENQDGKYVNTTETVVSNIYTAFNQDLFYRLRNGSIGFSGELAEAVRLEYCEQVTKEQRFLSRIYKNALEHWAEGVMPYNGSADVQINPLVKSVTNGTL
jgi:hypothetical protein